MKTITQNLALHILVSTLIIINVKHLESRQNPTKKTVTTVINSSFRLNCSNNLDDDEEIKSISWTKDGIQISHWSKTHSEFEFLDKQLLKLMKPGYTLGNLQFYNASMNLEGIYQCITETNRGKYIQQTQVKIIVPPTCHLDTKRFNGCDYYIRLKCPTVFPEPVSSCGVYDIITKALIIGIPVDIAKTNSGPEYSVTLEKLIRIIKNESFRLTALDLKPQDNPVKFKCKIGIPNTNYSSQVLIDVNTTCHNYATNSSFGFDQWARPPLGLWIIFIITFSLDMLRKAVFANEPGISFIIQ